MMSFLKRLSGWTTERGIVMLGGTKRVLPLAHSNVIAGEGGDGKFGGGICQFEFRTVHVLSLLPV